ncbi:MAG: hypothetical protein ABJB61_14455, partial [bacterium]
AFATAVVSANAQSSNKLVAHIPFQYVVGDKAMVSGEYELRAAGSNGVALIVQSTNAKRSAIRLTTAIESPASQRPKTTRPRLVFHRYGERYFLAEVWSGGDRTGLQLLKSRQERATERELARISPKGDSRPAYESVEVLALNR